MKAEAHRLKAERIEHGLGKLQIDEDPENMIEIAWGAAIHWIAFGCETKYHQHQNNHTRLGKFLQIFGENAVADWWSNLDTARQRGWYGGEPGSNRVQEALEFLTNIRQWATQ